MEHKKCNKIAKYNESQLMLEHRPFAFQDSALTTELYRKIFSKGRLNGNVKF